MKRALVLAVALMAGACAGTDELSPDAASDLQERVSVVRDAAEGGDIETAARELEEVRARLDELVASGEVSPERAAEIMAALDEVEAGLALIEPSQPPEETTPPPTEGNGGDGDGGDGGDGDDGGGGDGEGDD